MFLRTEASPPPRNHILILVPFDIVSFGYRTSSKNLDYDKENNQEEENLMKSETFVNEVYDEQVSRRSRGGLSEEKGWRDRLLKNDCETSKLGE